MKKVALAMAIALVGSLVSVAPASAGSWCNNGKYSSNSGRGTCSGNGGVNYLSGQNLSSKTPSRSDNFPV